MAANVNVGTEIGSALLSKQLDVQQEAGKEMVKMMEQSVNPAVGGNFDVSV
ncbi:MAG: YjfB family protein [Lachnospiraceae bacterium]|nr:YjfB family protein [Lachnospiraceae bacterium]